MIDFDWAMDGNAAETFTPVLRELGIEVAPRPGEAPRDDTQTFTLLEQAGLMLDQQAKSNPEPTLVLLRGAASTDALAQAIYAFASQAGFGGVLVDLGTTPAQITEVRGVNGPTVVLADAAGARQLQVSVPAIGSALLRADAPAS